MTKTSLLALKPSRIPFWCLAFLSLGVGLASVRFFTLDPQMAANFVRPNMVANQEFFMVHVVTGIIALTLGIWQFMPRSRTSDWHKITGKIYIAACLVGAIAGFRLAIDVSAGPVAAVGFATLAVLWFGATGKAAWEIRRRDFAAHRRWMIRSYALTCAAITLRLMLPVAGVLALDMGSAYGAIAWACWIVNLALAEILITRWVGVAATGLRQPA
ncbi:MAG: DUF2306 domain-containing protein [Alphaproteobacteria bacterium]